MNARGCSRNLMLHGLPEKTVKRVLEDIEPWAVRGSKSSSNVRDAFTSY